MSIIKSFSVGKGDMFYIDHNSDNFTSIDCCYEKEITRKKQLAEIKQLADAKGLTRFISTHPDEDHLRGLPEFCNEIGISNFYCVKNEATESSPSSAFKKYCELRDGSSHYFVEKGCTRQWMNQTSDDRKSAGINFLWPVANNSKFAEALNSAKKGEAFNNISPIFTYSLNNGVTAMWMGDMEAVFMEEIKDEVDWQKIDILFAPHHGRDSGKPPESILKKLNPQIVVIGEAPAKHLNYYKDYNTITQNSAGDIVFECTHGKVHVFVSSASYSVDFLNNEDLNNSYGHYIGSFQPYD